MVFSTASLGPALPVAPPLLELQKSRLSRRPGHSETLTKETESIIENIEVVYAVKVAGLWNNEREWDSEKLSSLFVEEAVQKILQVPLMQDDSSDMLFWKHTKNGQCTSKSAHKEFYKGETQNLRQGIFREPSQVNYLAEAMINTFSQVASQSDLQVIEYPMENIRRADNFPDGIRCVTFLTDNATIANTAKKRRFMEEPGHWSSRPF
ncbi:Os11g0203800 [Oryza sativa Japonica Group]|uniref:Os11g0203800 protein n=1 Tax=Oryza sativa subsp. japonica TaxID=39947 RepID=A0A0P0Y0G3_ORYSJ|nr:Os11g0203800 [Oryza sativa Japonica Group]